MSKKRRQYPQRVPRYVPGIRLQESRSTLGSSWWARKWLSILEGMRLGGRMGRGRVYASSGQIIKLTIDDNVVTAKVMGARPDPYEVNIIFRKPTNEQRVAIVTALRNEPMLVARLLTGDLPMQVESIFRINGAALFPAGKLADRVYDMTTSCRCPDYMNPCKHSVAVLFILGEEVARRPSLLLELRGIKMEELIV